MKCAPRLTALLLTFLSFVICEGKNLLRQIDVASGLPDNFVKWAVKDSEGYMWFATLNGLSRWDGYSFRTYRIGHFGGHNDDVQWVAEDGSGRIWVGNPSGYFTYDKETDSMRGEIAQLLQPLGIDCKPDFLSIDGSHNLWCADDNNLFYYEFKTKHLSKYTKPKGLNILDAKGLGNAKYVLFENGMIYSVKNGRLVYKNIKTSGKHRSKCLFFGPDGPYMAVYNTRPRPQASRGRRLCGDNARQAYHGHNSCFGRRDACSHR